MDTSCHMLQLNIFNAIMLMYGVQERCENFLFRTKSFGMIKYFVYATSFAAIDDSSLCRRISIKFWKFNFGPCGPCGGRQEDATWPS